MFSVKSFQFKYMCKDVNERPPVAGSWFHLALLVSTLHESCGLRPTQKPCLWARQWQPARGQSPMHLAADSTTQLDRLLCAAGPQCHPWKQRVELFPHFNFLRLFPKVPQMTSISTCKMLNTLVPVTSSTAIAKIGVNIRKGCGLL